ncbi:MAG TPA: hypothetical protein VGJ84_14265 [Polyangiaceae bacterium]|jgi:hypothetical protein
MRPFDPNKPDLCCEIAVPRIVEPPPSERCSQERHDIVEAQTADYDTGAPE